MAVLRLETPPRKRTATCVSVNGIVYVEFIESGFQCGRMARFGSDVRTNALDATMDKSGCGREP